MSASRQWQNCGLGPPQTMAIPPPRSFNPDVEMPLLEISQLLIDLRRSIEDRELQKRVEEIGLRVEQLLIDIDPDNPNYQDDPLTSAQCQINNAPDSECSYCGNPLKDHTAAELATCILAERDRVMCPTCGKANKDHETEEWVHCQHNRPILKKATPTIS